MREGNHYGQVLRTKAIISDSHPSKWDKGFQTQHLTRRHSSDFHWLFQARPFSIHSGLVLGNAKMTRVCLFLARPPISTTVVFSNSHISQKKKKKFRVLSFWKHQLHVIGYFTKLF